MTKITGDFYDVECANCLDTGEYYNGKEMKKCKCKKDDDKGSTSETSKPNS